MLTLATGVPALAETVRHDTYYIYNGSVTLDGSVDTNDPVGVDVTAQESGADPENVSVNVTGDVKVQTSNTDYKNSVSGVDVYSHVTNASVNVSIGQDDDDGNYTGGTVTVTSTGKNGTANGVEITNEGTGPVNVNTGKIDVTATGGFQTNGASVSSYGGIHAEGGTATGVSATLSGEESANIIIEVTDGIFATGTEDSAGIRIENMIDAPILSSDSEITIVSDENVESSGTGIVDMNTINGVKTNLVVEGAVIAEAGPAVSVVTQSLSNLNLTVWKLESKTGQLVAEQTETGYVDSDTAKQFEKAIDYIIKVAPNASDYTDLTAAQKTVAGYTYDVGKAGEKMAVTFHVPDGYTIDSAYSDESRTALQHVSGNEYLLVVPNGGSVMINPKLVPVSNNGGGEDDNYSGNPPAEYESHNFSRSGSHYSLTLRKNQMEVVLSTAELKALLESGLTELTFMTSAGNFTFPSADLWTMVNNFATVRFAIEEGHMNAYGDNNTAAFKTVDPDVVENTVS
ncbi:hypothetical protein ACTQ56_09465 [[Clostridium] aminophilum]|uniref:hypothetical protein n=1 Tax=[Clostridium] aminophilum TaxID=1526 RepID=UPI003F9E1B1B